MAVRYLADPIRFSRMTTEEIRATFLVERLFVPEEVVLLYVNVDGAVVGSAVPGSKPLRLQASKEMAAQHFCERRELGVLNIGAKGRVTVDGVEYELENKDILYVGQGAKEVVFESEQLETLSAFYFLSFPAHRALPTKNGCVAEAATVYLGEAVACNEHKIYRYIHVGGVNSCQLVMGITVVRQAQIGTPCPRIPIRGDVRFTFISMWPKKLGFSTSWGWQRIRATSWWPIARR